MPALTIDYSNKTDGKISAARRIANSLAEDIAAGLLAPGQRIDETSLAKRFGVSRTPIREALTLLTGQGILTASRGRGCFVSKYSPTELSQMFEAMQVIEEICTNLAAKRLTLLAQADIVAKQNACTQAAKDGDFVAFGQANEAFHQAIYAAMQNPFLAELASSFRHRTGPFRAKRYRSKQGRLQSIKFHEALVNSIIKEDPSLASLLRKSSTEAYIEALHTMKAAGIQ